MSEGKLSREPGVSVVIAAKNEAENLLQNLPYILNQNYTEFEIVVANDCSWDNTEEVLEAFKSETDKLKVVTLSEEIHKKTGKKFALTLGIKAAKYDILLFTDADCAPESAEWIREMVKPYIANEDTEIVLGVGKIQKGSSNLLLNLIVYFDTLTTAARYLSFALGGTTYMGVGRNLSYKKDLFFKMGGFKKHYTLMGGDDDLFINESATEKNVTAVYNPQAFTLSNGPKTFKAYFRQKKRHLTSGNRYKIVHKLILTLEPLSLALILVGLFLTFIEKNTFFVLITLYFLRTLIYTSTFVLLSKYLNIRLYSLIFIIMEPIIYVLNATLILSNKIKKPRVWR
ncbi:MAG: glycosyltransferase [Luteibaculaceae bacterium]